LYQYFWRKSYVIYFLYIWHNLDTIMFFRCWNWFFVKKSHLVSAHCIPIASSSLGCRCQLAFICCDLCVAVRIFGGKAQVTAYQIQIDSWHVTSTYAKSTSITRQWQLVFRGGVVRSPQVLCIIPQFSSFDCRVTFRPSGFRAGVELASWFALPGPAMISPFTNFYVVVAVVIASAFPVRKWFLPQHGHRHLHGNQLIPMNCKSSNFGQPTLIWAKAWALHRCVLFKLKVIVGKYQGFLGTTFRMPEIFNRVIVGSL